MNRHVTAVRISTTRRRAFGALAALATAASSLVGVAMLQRTSSAIVNGATCSNSVDWTSATQPASTMTGTFTGGNTVTMTLGTTGGNAGLAFSSDWGTNTATDGGVVGANVTNKEAMAIYGTSGGNTVNVSFANDVTDPVVYVNYVDSGTELDFGSRTVTLLDSNPTATVTGSKVAINGGNGGNQGFAVRVTGTYASGSDKLTFTYKVTSNDTMGISFSYDDICLRWCTVPYLAQGASQAIGTVSVTATTNQAKDAATLSGTYTNYYWHDATQSKIQTIWSFSGPVLKVRMTTLAHADAGIESYTFTGKDASDNTVLTQTITNRDTTKELFPSAGMTKLQADFTPTSGNYGSLVKLEIGTAAAACTPACDFIPFTSSGNVTAGATTVTVSQNSSANWGSGNYWLFVSDGRQFHRLTFNPPITELSLQTAYHADSPGGVEKFAFLTKDANGNDVFATNIVNRDTTVTYAFSSPVATLETSFTPQNNTRSYGSLVRYKIPAAPGACGAPINPPPPPIVTANSGHIYSGQPTGTIGYAVAPSGTTWDTAPTCAVYDTTDTNYLTPKTGILDPGSYATQCKGAVKSGLTITYQAGTFVVDQPPVITASSYVDGNALTYPGTIPSPVGSSAAGVPAGKTITTPATCAVYADDWLLDADALPALTSPLGAGTYVTKCSGAVVDNDPNIEVTYVSGSLVVNKVGTTTAYTGDDFILAGSSSLDLASTVTPVTGSGPCSGTVTYSLDVNPLTGGSGPYTLASNPASTTGWLAGAYVVTASYPGDSNCTSSSGVATVTVYTEGAGWGGGWFTVSGGKNTFGFVVQQFDRNKNTPAYTKGQVAWQSPQWRFKGTLNAAYSNAAKTQGTSSGTGTLWYFQKSGGTGTGTWVKASATDVAITIDYTATTPSTKKKNGSPGSFGISFSGTPAAGVPALPSMANPVTLNEGNIKVA